MGLGNQCTRRVAAQGQPTGTTAPWRWVVGGAIFLFIVGSSVTTLLVLGARTREAVSIREIFESSSKDRAHAMMEGVVELVEGALACFAAGAGCHCQWPLAVGATLSLSRGPNRQQLPLLQQNHRTGSVCTPIQ